MFSWKKAKDDKKKKEKEKRERKAYQEPNRLTGDELQRLNKVQQSYQSAHHRMTLPVIKSSRQEDAPEKRSNSSQNSLNSIARSSESSPVTSSSHTVDQPKVLSPTKKPPPVPKKPVLRGKVNSVPQSPSPTTPNSMSSRPSSHGSGSLANEMLAFIEQMNQKQGAGSDTFDAATFTPDAHGDVPNFAGTGTFLPGEHSGPGSAWKAYSMNLKLPPIVAASPPRIRTLTISRQQSGDFGFSLRRAATITDPRHGDGGEWKQTVIFAEPSTLGRGNETGLLPGDRLLEVNNVSVENRTREEIIDMIKSSGDKVTLKVQPVPELSELTVRMGSDGREVELADHIIRLGTLSRSANIRYKSMAKSEEQLQAERAWLQCGKVWLVHKGGFSAAKLIKKDEIPGTTLSEGKVGVCLEGSWEVLEVDEEDVEKANPPQFERVEDLTHLRYVNESSILQTLRQRFGSGLIHTYAGPTLVVVNPLHSLAIYSEKVMRIFRGCRQDDLPPHIFAVAQVAYGSMLEARRNQSVVLLGRSGSGKTISFRHLLHYLVFTSGTVNKVVTVEKLNAVTTLMEAFGNSRTILNTNASRFAQFFTLDFDHSGQIVSGSVQVLMMDKTRVCRRPETEPNFHIFYQMLSGVDDSLRKELYLEDLSEPNLFMTPLQKAEDQHQASLAWAYILAAMQSLGIHTREAKAIWCVLAAIYHLGVAAVTLGGGGCRPQFAKPQSAQKAASLLGTSVEDLAKTIFSGDHSINGPGRGSPRVISDAEMLEPLQAFVAGLYNEVFNALQALINRALTGSGRSMASIHLLDFPGFQNPASCGRHTGATLEDLCHNYAQEKLHLLFHEFTFISQQERYAQENVAWNSGNIQGVSPSPVVNIIDQTPPQQGPGRSSAPDLRELDQRGIFWMLDEESLFPGATEHSFLDRVFVHHSKKDHQHFLQRGPQLHQLTLQHFCGTNPVIYNSMGWLHGCREHPVSRQAAPILQDSHKEHISQLFVSCRGPALTTASGVIVGTDTTSSLRRASSIRRAQSVAAVGAKRRSLPLQSKYTMDVLIDVLRKTQLHFVHCLLPQHCAGLCHLKHSPHPKNGKPEDAILNVPLLRSQIRGFQLLGAVQVYKQGFPEHLLYMEFRRKFEILVPPEHRQSYPVLDERVAVETMIQHLDLDASSVRLGLSQIFLRAGTLAQLEAQRDDRVQSVVIQLQACCRGYLARNHLKKLMVQDMAIRCIQRNVRKFLVVRSWPWWRLLVKVLPLLNVHRTEQELRLKSEELESFRAKAEKLEKERNDLKHSNERLEAKVSELWTDLAEEQSASNHASALLESESSERMRLEKEVRELQSRCCDMEQKTEQMEMEVMEARMYRTAELNGDLSDDDGAESSSIYKQKYEQAMREMDMTKRRLQQQHEEDIEKQLMARKSTEKKLAESLADVEEERQTANQWKRKTQKLSSELQDLQLLLEEQMSRNAELEKKQRKFDADSGAVQEDIRQERIQKERLQREKDQAHSEKFALEQEIQSLHLEMEMQSEKVHQLTRELDELTYSSRGEEEVMQLKRSKQEYERKLKDQEEELEDLASQVQLLEQAKLRLEMSLEKARQEHRREISVRDEEIEEVRASASKKVKNFEAQLEAEQDERHQLLRQKHELERRLIDMNDRPPPRDPEKERRLCRDLKRTKALLRDAQMMLEHTHDGQGNKALIRQLKNQVEDAEFAKTAAVKARQGAEMEIQELQTQLEEMSRLKNESESRCSQLSRERNALQTQLEELEEEQGEVMKKYKSSVFQMSTDQKLLNEQSMQISELEAEKLALREQVVELTSRVDRLAGQSEDQATVRRLEAKVRDLESRLELEQTNHSRVESQLSRCKEQCEHLREDCESLRLKEQQTQEGTRRFQRQLREVREDYTVLQQKESEVHQKCHELEMALENAEADVQATKNDLRLACQRIQDLQNALEDEVDTDVVDDSGSDSDSSTDVESTYSRSRGAFRHRHSSVASSASSVDLGIRSRTSSINFGMDSPISSSLMWRQMATDYNL